MQHKNLLEIRFSNTANYRWPRNNFDLEIEWLRSGETFYARPKNAPTQLLWSFSSNGGNREFMESWIWALRRREVTRCHNFEEKLVFINRDEGVLPLETNPIQGAAFHLPPNVFPLFHKPQISLFASVETVQKGLETLAQNADSDFNLARQWALFSQERWAFIRFSRLTRHETENLLRALWILFDGQDERQMPVLRFGPDNCVTAQVQAKTPAIPSQILAVFNQHSGLKSVKRARRHSRGYWYKDKPWTFYRPAATPSTAHEKLEALLLWREFLADKLSPSEIEALLTAF